MTYRQCEAKTAKGTPCKNGTMGFSKYCGPHTDKVQDSEVIIKNVDIIETLRFHASKPGSPVFYAHAVKELEQLREENKKLRAKLHAKTQSTLCDDD